MFDPFSLVNEVVFSSSMSNLVDYDFRNGQIVAQISALIGTPDTEGDLEVRVSHDIRRFEIRVSDLPINPARGHRIVLDLEEYEVQRQPHKDQLGLNWLIDAYLVV